LNENDDKIECTILSKEATKLVRHVNGIEVGKEITKNMPMPISLSPVSGVSGYIAFANYQGVVPLLTTDANFLIHTNQGQPFRVKLPLAKLDSRQLLKL
jgi:hypothetical protein